MDVATWSKGSEQDTSVQRNQVFIVYCTLGSRQKQDFSSAQKHSLPFSSKQAQVNPPPLVIFFPPKLRPRPSYKAGITWPCLPAPTYYLLPNPAATQVEILPIHHYPIGEIYIHSRWEMVHILLGPWFLIHLGPIPSMDIAALHNLTCLLFSIPLRSLSPLLKM